MREIKFKAFHKVEKKMCNVVSINFRDEFIDVVFPEYEGLGESYFDTMMLDEFDLIQFTGLTDKHGVEIYEGDIIDDHIGTGVVEYSHSGFRANYNDSLCKWLMDYLVSEARTIEVIGNIYEDKHLLDSPT